MLRCTLLSVCFLLCVASSALADIVVWEGISENCTIDHDENTIQINAAGTYGFRAWDPGTEELEAIQWIRVHSGASGTVTVKIAYDAGGGAGATDVWEIDLSNATTGILAKLEITEDLGQTNGVTVHSVSGEVEMGGNLLNTFDVADGISAPITIGGLLSGNISADSANDITVNGTGTHSGSITVRGAYSDALALAGPMNGDIWIQGNMSGTIAINGTMGGGMNGYLYITGNLSGSVNIAGNASGFIDVTGYTTAQSSISLGSMIDPQGEAEVIIHGNHAGELVVTGAVQAGGALIVVVGDLSGSVSVGQLDAWGNISVYGVVTASGSITAGSAAVNSNMGCIGQMAGSIAVTGDSGALVWLYDRVPSGGAITIGGSILAGSGSGVYVADDFDGEMNVAGSMLGTLRIAASLGGAIEVGGDLAGKIRINGSLKDNPGQAYEVEVVGNITSTGAVTVDYDGWDPNDTWEDGAIVRVDGTDYFGNTPSEHIWEITGCKGDMNNDRVVNDDDEDPFDDARHDPDQYAEDFPGLEGSMIWHGDMDCDNELDADDDQPFDYFIDEGCTNCTPECQYRACVADIDEDGEVGHTDLGILLAAYDTCDGDPDYNPDADLDGDECVDQVDLGLLLAEWGNPCDCYDGRDGGGGEGPGGQGARVWVEPYDTNGFTNGGFAGESDHFVFDLVIEITEPANDWTTSGVVARAENGATFRLAPGPTDPDQYASFVSAPRVVDDGPPPNSSGATVAGAYLPADSDYDFASRIINLSWFDKVDSKDGPAAVMRLVIDVSAVPGADTSGGLGSVYFSQTGPALPADIKVVGFRSATASRCDGGALTGHDGEFFVKAD